jgi:hypothetical protein
MGGGQTNSAQAAQADTASMAASQASAALSTTQNAEQQQSYNYLFGDPSTPGSTGTLTQFMNPNALNVTTPTGAFGAQYNQATDTLAQNYANQRGSLAQQFANQGFTGSGAPSGFQAEQENQLGQAQANAQGNLFASAVGNQYQTGLTNFWNANNIAAGQSASLAPAADSASAQSGSTANGVYQTAGAATPGALNSALGAAGAVGAGAASNTCPARGAQIRTERGDLKVEDLEKGDKIYQSDRRYFALPAKPQKVLSRCMEIFTSRRSSTVSASHCFSMPLGGYTEAADAVGKHLSVYGARAEKVHEAADAGEREVFIMPAVGNNTYLCDGIWSLV